MSRARCVFMIAAMLILISLLGTVVPARSAAANRAPRELVAHEQIDAYTQSRMRAARIPGLALGVVRGDQIVYLKGYGIAGPDGRTVTPQTPFILGSTSKSFTALAVLLKDVNQHAAHAMVILVAIATTMMCLNEVFQFAALRVATDGSYVSAFGAAGAHALVLLLLDMHHYGFLMAQIFFGLWLVPLGYLAYTSEMFPKALGVALIVGGVAYLVDMLAAFLAPDVGTHIHGFLTIPPTSAEIWMLGYLLVKGVNVPDRGILRQRMVVPAPE